MYLPDYQIRDGFMGGPGEIGQQAQHRFRFSQAGISRSFPDSGQVNLALRQALWETKPRDQVGLRCTEARHLLRLAD